VRGKPKNNSLPALEAAHIRPFAKEGPHEVRNGLLLRADLHRLFEQGYLTVTPEYTLDVSDRLRYDYHNAEVTIRFAEARFPFQPPRRASDSRSPRLAQSERLSHRRDGSSQCQQLARKCIAAVLVRRFDCGVCWLERTGDYRSADAQFFVRHR